MVFQEVPNGAEIVIHGSAGGQDVVNTFHATHSGAWGETELTALAAAVDTWVGAVWLPLQALDYLYLATTARDLRTPIATESRCPREPE